MATTTNPATTNPAPNAPPLDPSDQSLLDVIEAFEAACVSKDADAIIANCAPNVCWHADLVTLARDIHGHQALRAYLASYPRAYDYTHVPLGRAVDGAAGFGFTLSMDEHVVPKKDGPHGDQADCPPSTTIALAYLVFERQEGGGGGGGDSKGGGGEGGTSEGATSPAPKGGPDQPYRRITDIFMQRELSVDEALRRFGAPPADYTRVTDALPLDALRFGGGGTHDPARAAKHAVAAEAINEAWRTGDASPALSHLADDVVRVNAMTGSLTKGKEAFARMLDHVFAKYELMWHSSAFAVTPGNKAVTFFTAAAQYDNEFCQPSGQSVLLFNEDDKVSHMVDFTTPLPGMRSKLLGRGGAGMAGEAARGQGAGLEAVMRGEAGPPEGEAAAQVAAEVTAPAVAGGAPGKVVGAGAEEEVAGEQEARTPEA